MKCNVERLPQSFKLRHSVRYTSWRLTQGNRTKDNAVLVALFDEQHANYHIIEDTSLGTPAQAHSIHYKGVYIRSCFSCGMIMSTGYKKGDFLLGTLKPVVMKPVCVNRKFKLSLEKRTPGVRHAWKS